mmetsp:Transcript_19355/g.30750  ORF Transcript_19355/g.30750 Transcript_19355/m.30750 type:complete len:89 (-) Transcript_19355:408-674(-)
MTPHIRKMRGLRYSCGYYLPNPGINDTIYLEGSPEGIPSRHVGDALESPGEIYESLQISRCESRAASCNVVEVGAKITLSDRRSAIAA